MEISLGICGTAFRKDDMPKCNKNIFEAMYVVSNALLNQCKKNNYEITTCVSGGAAGADYVAVKLFLDKKVSHLKLFLPCEWDNGSFLSKREKDEGSILNYYHKKFQTATFINSLSQMQVAKNEGADFISCRGFYARNYLIAKSSDFLLACTFGHERELKPGGSAHCVKCYLERVRKEGIFDKSFHYELNSGKIFMGCTVPKEPVTYSPS